MVLVTSNGAAVRTPRMAMKLEYIVGAVEAEGGTVFTVKFPSH